MLLLSPEKQGISQAFYLGMAYQNKNLQA